MEKMQKFSKIALKVIKVLMILDLAALVIVLGVSIFFLALSPSALPLTRLGFGPLQLVLSAEGGIPSRSFLLLFLSAGLTGSLGFVILLLLQKILQPMSQGRPFAGQVSPSIRKIAWCYLVSDFLRQIITHGLGAVAFRQLQQLNLLALPEIARIQYNAEFSLNGLFVFGILLLLSYVFQYGQQLQQLSDDTI